MHWFVVLVVVVAATASAAVVCLAGPLLARRLLVVGRRMSCERLALRGLGNNSRVQRVMLLLLLLLLEMVVLVVQVQVDATQVRAEQVDLLLAGRWMGLVVLRLRAVESLAGRVALETECRRRLVRRNHYATGLNLLLAAEGRALNLHLAGRQLLRLLALAHDQEGCWLVVLLALLTLVQVSHWRWQRALG